MLSFIIGINSYTKPVVEIAENQYDEKKIEENREIKPLDGKRILIDPGHQKKGNLTKEPIAPNSEVMKAKVTYGTTGIVTGVPEYVFALDIGKKLKKEFVDLGAEVFMTREEHEVDISNRQRAIIGNEMKVDLVIKIHADGSDNKNVQGISILYPSYDGDYTQKIAEDSSRAANLVLKNLILHTEGKNRGTIPRKDITGFNWSEVPVILIECGYMSNVEEDILLNDPVYKNKLTMGIVEGALEYFSEKQDEKINISKP